LTILDFLIVDSLLIGDWRLLIAFDVRGSTAKSIHLNRQQIKNQHSTFINDSIIKDQRSSN